MSDLLPDKDVTFSQGRHGEVYVTQGHGKRPQVWRESKGGFETIGIDAPASTPNITLGTGVTYYVARVDIVDRGSGYLAPPTASISPPTGSRTTIAPPGQGVDGSGTGGTLPPPVPPEGAKAASVVVRIAGGSLSETQIVEHGRGYPSPPTVTLTPTSVATACDPQNLVAGCYSAGKLQAIMRATFRGTYLCYYRYVDDSVPESEGGPLYSNLSPVTEVKAGDGLSSITWEVPTPPPGLGVELWRTTGDQAIILYRIAKYDSSGNLVEPKVTQADPAKFFDDLNDNEVLNANREGFAAMPITLPNGEINANRFTPPPDDYAVGVVFQDRFWMGVHAPSDPNAKPQPNTLRFSEQDEPQAMPDVNEIIVQQNLRSADFITALVPYAGAMLVMQSRHCHRLTYVRQPVIDAGIFLFAYRGCLNQRCWDIYEGRCFSLDTSGVYSVDPQGKLDDLSVGIDDIFQEKIDWSKRQWFYLRAERSSNTLRVSVAFKGDEGQYPTRQLVYALDYKSWWVELYPQVLTAACDVRTKSGQNVLIYGAESGKIFRLNEGTTDHGEGFIESCTVTGRGRGYRRPPKVTVSGGSGAVIESAINQDGEVTGLLIKHNGTGYTSGVLTIEPAPPGGVDATGSFTASSGEVPVYYSMRSGNMEFTTDTQNDKAAAANNRQISVVYRPTEGHSTLNLQTFYNGASYARSNVVRRDRGVGFINSDEVPAATLDMVATSEQLSESHGVARALFSGRTLDDMDGSDRHIAVGLAGKQKDGRVVVHSLDIHGVNPQE